MKNFLYGITFLIVAASFTTPTVSVKQFSWLQGKWKMQGKEMYEEWRQSTDDLLKGESYRMEAEGRSKQEDIELIVSGNRFYYVPTVVDQNGDRPVRFAITRYTDTSFVAENTLHDFPQKIAYTLTDSTHLHAYIEGSLNGKTKRIDFKFTRVP